MSDDDVENLVDVRAMAEYLSISEHSVRQYAKNGIIPGHRLGTPARGRWRFVISEVREHLNETRRNERTAQARKGRSVDLSTMAQALGHAEYTVRTWAQNGEIPAVKVGTQWRFFVPEVREHIAIPLDAWCLPRDAWKQRRLLAAIDEWLDQHPE